MSVLLTNTNRFIFHSGHNMTYMRKYTKNIQCGSQLRDSKKYEICA